MASLLMCAAATPAAVHCSPKPVPPPSLLPSPAKAAPTQAPVHNSKRDYPFLTLYAPCPTGKQRGNKPGQFKLVPHRAAIAIIPPSHQSLPPPRSTPHPPTHPHLHTHPHTEEGRKATAPSPPAAHQPVFCMPAATPLIVIMRQSSIAAWKGCLSSLWGSRLSSSTISRSLGRYEAYGLAEPWDSNSRMWCSASTWQGGRAGGGEGVRRRGWLIEWVD